MGQNRSPKSEGSSTGLSYLAKHPAALIPAFFIFLAARNWPVFLLADLRDGFYMKTAVVSDGFSLPGIKFYIKYHMLRPWNGHFIPLWFVVFFGLSYFFDSNPWAEGFLSFGFAAILLYLIFRIVYHFFNQRPNGYLYSLMVALVFSSTGFFLEMIAWKWMTGLLMSSVFFCLALIILLEKNLTLKWQIVYTLALFSSFWTFGSAWVQAWGLLLFLFLSGRKWNERIVVLTAIIAFIGTALSIIANHNSIPALNPLFLITNLPAIFALAATNVLLLTVGVFRFGGLQEIYVSSVLGVTIIMALSFHFYSRYKEGRGLSKIDALVVSLLLTFLATIVLSLLRLTPANGITPTSSPENYIIGGRYLFVYSIPLILALAIALGKRIAGLPRNLLYIFMLGALAYGVIIQATYRRVDPDISNTQRTEFYNLTLKALQAAEAKHLPLPELSGGLFVRGYEVNLSEAAKVRKDAYKYHPVFKDPHEISASECFSLRQDPTISRWLNLYNKNWCDK